MVPESFFWNFSGLLEHADFTYHVAPILGKVFGQRNSEVEVWPIS